MSCHNFKLLTILSVFLVVFSSCKKDNNNHPDATSVDYYIKFTLDGTAVLHANNAEGNINVLSGGKYTFSGAALKIANVPASNNVTLSISNATQLATGVTYVNYANANANAGFQRAVLSTVSYIDASGVVFNSWGDEFAAMGVVSNSQITFTEISATNIKGTFSGTSYKSISGTAEKHVLTKGEFNLKRR